MRRTAMLLVLLSIVTALSCSEQVSTNGNGNPLLAEFDTPFGVPPFDRIETEHYMPAFEQGMKEHQKEIMDIASNSDDPTFENTVEAMDRSGGLLAQTSNIFFGLNSARTDEKMQAIAREVAPMLSEHRDNIMLNEELFGRIKSVYQNRDRFELDQEQSKLLEEYYKDFVRGGADLNEKKKERLREINKELSGLTVQFGENVLKEVNRYELIIEDSEDLAGLPENVIETAAEEAAGRDYDGKWVFTLSKPSMLPFLQYSERRDLREQIYKAYLHKGDNDDDLDNKGIINRIVNLRLEKAKVLGYPTHADFVLEERMAEKPANVHELLNELWEPALQKAKEEAAMMQEMIDDEGGDFELQGWDWWYYAEKIRKKKYALDEEMLKPYFKLDNVMKGAFDVANKLYGITIEERSDLPKYHEDVRTFEVRESDGSHIGIFYTDYFPRESKRGGAWMGNYREQYYIGGREVSPVVVNVGNFSKPTGSKPSLLSWDNVLTLFHEFGHGLHGLLTDCHYRKLSGTNVATDFVELPSQIMENWAEEPEVIKMFAKHYQTGETIPDELIEKIEKSSKFNQGFALTEYLAASILDMHWHSITEKKDFDVNSFEKKVLDDIGLIPEIASRYRSTYFRHIFAGGYSAGYYSYIWSEVLDADAFEAFKEKSLFDSRTASSFRNNILSRGGTEDPMVLYKRFRGSEPEIEPLLRSRGLI
ncbi:MAG: peptidase M3 [Candidatus Latescibacteria bacterium]|nr:peptidase M3 [bacterium]MBD3423207.1 peptidase M3 [Candidatus Latescibacterota bacterium]